jgi:predicted HTH transcriptional regulator
LVLDKYDDSSDYKIVIEDFNKELGKNLSDEKLLELLKKAINTDVFRTKDEVIVKLSNEIAQLRMKEYDYEKKIENLSKIDFLSVRSRILILLAKNPELSIKELRKIIKTSKKWLESVIETLQKNKIIAYDSKKDGYYLIF